MQTARTGRQRRQLPAYVALATTFLLALGAGRPPTVGAASAAATKSVVLPGSSRYEVNAVQPGASNSIWVVGSHSVWHVAASGQIAQTVPLPASMSPSPSTATATAEGGVSFLVMPSGAGGPVALEHVSPTGALSTLSVSATLEANNIPDGPLAATPSGLWGAWWHAPEGGSPFGGLIQIDAATGVATNYTLPLAPFTVDKGPGGGLWVGGITSGVPAHHGVSLVSPTGMPIKTITLPGPVGHDNDVMSAPAPGLGVWVAVTGLAAYISPAGRLTTYRLPHGGCESPYALTAGAGGTGWLLAGATTTHCFRASHSSSLQLIKLSAGRLRATPVRVPGLFGIFPALATFADGEFWIAGGNGSARALYVLPTR